MTDIIVVASRHFSTLALITISVTVYLWWKYLGKRYNPPEEARKSVLSLKDGFCARFDRVQKRAKAAGDAAALSNLDRYAEFRSFLVNLSQESKVDWHDIEDKLIRACNCLDSVPRCDRALVLQ